MSATNQPGLVSLVDAAGYLSISTKTVRRYIAEGRLTGYRIGTRAIRVDLDEVKSLARVVPAVQRSA